MSRKNIPFAKPPVFTHEGAPAVHTDNYNRLRRSVMACLLWEDSFYESGQTIANRISELVKLNKPEKVAEIAVEARNDMKLRHVPLLLARELVALPSHRYVVGNLLPQIIQRPDEIGEFLSLYWQNQPNAPLAAQVKKGLAAAFNNFDEYQLAKWDQGAIRLRNAMFMVHPRPTDAKDGTTVDPIKRKNYARGAVKRDTEHVFSKIASDTLRSPETWERELSAGADKAETFTRLINEKKLGAMALLRNLRGMIESGVSRDVIRYGIQHMNAERVLPFRFLSAAAYAPQFEPELESAMYKCLEGTDKLLGETILLVDVSGSMDNLVSSKSELTRIDAACGLAILLREVCDSVRVFTFSKKTIEVPPRRGFALRDAIKNSQEHKDTFLGNALDVVKYGAGAARIIVITDEQSAQVVKAPATTGYVLNVASYQNGVGYGAWNKIDGWSEACVKYIQALESDGK